MAWNEGLIREILGAGRGNVFTGKETSFRMTFGCSGQPWNPQKYLLYEDIYTDFTSEMRDISR